VQASSSTQKRGESRALYRQTTLRHPHLHPRAVRLARVGKSHLKELVNLQTLYLGGTKVTDAGVAELQKALPDCKIYK